MRFALSTEQRDFVATVNDALSASDTVGAARAWAEGQHDRGRKLWHVLGEIGVWGLLVPEDCGGVGARPTDAVLAWEACGWHGVPGPVVETLGVAPRVLGAGDLGALAAGELLVTAAFPPRVPRAVDADVADVVVRVDRECVTRVDPESVVDNRALVSSIDPVRRLFAVPDRGVALGRPGAYAFELGVLGVSAQLIGAAQRMVDMATEYARQRRQYGREIGSYQAIKHMLADAVVRVELARPVVYGAAVALSDEDVGSACIAEGTHVVRDTSAAKVAATRAALGAARTALQVHGAIGYTAEHDLGLWLTKARALAGAWGDADYHRSRVLTAVRGSDGR